MTLPHPMTDATRTPIGFVGEAALRKPPAGTLGWLVRLELIVLLSAILWLLVVGLVRLIA